MTAPTATPTKFHHVAVTPPPVGVPVVIWWHVGEVRASWDGRQWRDPAGRILAGPILYWREVTA